MSRPHFLQPLLKKSSRAPALLNVRSGRRVATTIESAFDSADRRRGLLGREGLPAGIALVIAPTNLVHTFAMRFAIDILFVARSGRVLKVKPSVPPRRVAGAWGAFAVIELAAGALEGSDTRVGDEIQVVYD